MTVEEAGIHENSYIFYVKIKEEKNNNEKKRNKKEFEYIK